MSTSHDTFDFDVAFSFLSGDLGLAKELADQLVGLRTFVYERQKEDLLGRDGMDAFSETFARKARLAVILYRAGWGKTPWTAVEENAIKGRALDTRFSNFLAVRLDDAELPSWIPHQHLYVSAATEKSAVEMAAVIRARAREVGAVVIRESAADVAIERAATARASSTRVERERSHAAIAEIETAATELFENIVAVVQRIRTKEPSYPIEAGYHRGRCMITGGGVSTSIALYQSGSVDSPHHFVLTVGDWRGNGRIPTPSDGEPRGQVHMGNSHYSPRLSKSDEWVWRWEPNVEDGGVLFLSVREDVHRSAELADSIVNRHTSRLFERS